MEILNEKIIIESGNGLKVLNSMTGLEETVLPIKAFKMYVNDNKLFVIVKNEQEFEMRIYNSSFRLVNKYCLIDFHPSDSITIRNGEIDFYHNKNRIIKKYSKD
jgi:hypothetical protein